MKYDLFYKLCSTKIYLKRNVSAREAIQFCEANCEDRGIDYYYGGQKVWIE